MARSEDREWVLIVSGELDLAAAASLEQELDRALDSDADRIVLDLTALEFIDSTGLGVLVRGHKRAVAAGRTLGLVNPAPQVERLLELTGLADRLAQSDNGSQAALQ